MKTSTAAQQTPSLEDSVDASIDLALSNMARLQASSGAWPGDYGGPMFLLPMYIALCYAAKRLPQGHTRERILTYFFNVQRTDGSIGLHAEASEGSMFTTALSYCAIRMLGIDANDPRATRMREWIRSNGTPLGAASWGKFTLCVLGLYDWKGIHPLLPELWLLPKDAPLHPGKMWCHSRQVYLPMAWLYGTRSTVPNDALLTSLRSELYTEAWSDIRWDKHRDTISHADDYRPVSPVLNAINLSQVAYEMLPFKPLRARSLAECLHHIRYEDQVTNDIDIGPVNAVLNTMVHHFRGAEGADDFRRGVATLDQYLWDGHDGIKMQGYNNSELWDTAFGVQAILATGASASTKETQSTLRKAYNYLRDNQILDDVPDAEAHYRHASKGGWPFSNRAHGWPITDCTSEGFKCALLLEGQYSPEIPTDLLRDSVRLILSWQNDEGGWGTYEKKRGGSWYERMNPSQVFGDIMVDYSHVECTSACLQALVKAKHRFPGEFSLDEPIARGVQYIRSQQRPDGSFEGNWGVCFTYGTWFSVSGLLAAGVPETDTAIVRACAFLLSKQRADGAWSEHGDSCRKREWIEGERGHVAQTAWALMTLIRAKHPNVQAQERAVEFLTSTQESDGSWAREPLVGVFNRTCLINYDNYRHYFPLWALAEFRSSAATSTR